MSREPTLHEFVLGCFFVWWFVAVMKSGAVNWTEWVWFVKLVFAPLAFLYEYLQGVLQ